MAKSNNIKFKGFTIIEVVLVLAIAGLIFLMVFVALPNLQRNQRDTARRQDYAAIVANVSNYISNNNGRLPSGDDLDETIYINATGEDSIGNAYQLSAKVMQSGNANLVVLDKMENEHDTPEVVIYTHADCSGNPNGDAQPNYVTSSRAFAVYGMLEGGTYCQAS